MTRPFWKREGPFARRPAREQWRWSSHPVYRRQVVIDMRWEPVGLAEGEADEYRVPRREYWLCRQTALIGRRAVVVEIGAYKSRSTVALGDGCVGAKMAYLLCGRMWW